jgi:hypothetical protein
MNVTSMAKSECGLKISIEVGSKADMAKLMAKLFGASDAAASTSGRGKCGHKGKPSSPNAIVVPLNECLGMGLYPTRYGLKDVAIVRVDQVNGKEVNVLAWANVKEEIAKHDDGGFRDYGNKAQSIEWFGQVQDTAA